MAQYYTLDEAARVLQTSPDEVRKMADDKKLRTFRDKGTLRFRAQEIDELARQMGLGSDPDLQLGEVPSPKKGSSPMPARKSSKMDSPPPARKPPSSSKVDLGALPPARKTGSSKSGLGNAPSSSKRQSKIDKPPDAGEVFDFSLSLDDEEEQVQLGVLPPPGAGSSKSGSRRSKLGPASPSPKAHPPAQPPKSNPPASKASPPSPGPKPGSDSDVRLVGGDDDFSLPLEEEETPAPPSPTPRRKKPSVVQRHDTAVRIVPLSPSDSDVKMILPDPDAPVELGGSKAKSASDSDIRMEHPPSRPGDGSDPAMVTEEIDLDEEMRKLAPQTPAPKPRSSTPQLPTNSPFELSEEDLTLEEPPPLPVTDSSGDFELTPEGDESSPLELGSDEMPALEIEDSDEVSLGDLAESGGGSGINLKDPADSGISLEQESSSSDEIDFDLSLDAGGTPPPAAKQEGDSDSSEFELSLDDSDESGETVAADAESSEFELSLDDDSGSSELEVDLEPAAAEGEDSDSEFELTLDDSGGSSPLEEEAGEDKDIFETDFEVPALEEESGSEALALDEDTDLESNDFDIAIDEMDVGSEDESGSQVVALEDEEDLEAVAQPKRKTKMLAADEEEEDGSPFGDISPTTLGEDEEEIEEKLVPSGGRVRVEYVDKPAAPWGPVPVILMLPCVIVLFLVGLMGFELIQGMMSYQKTGKYSSVILQPLTEAITGEKLPGAKK